MRVTRVGYKQFYQTTVDVRGSKCCGCRRRASTPRSRVERPNREQAWVLSAGGATHKPPFLLLLVVSTGIGMERKQAYASPPSGPTFLDTEAAAGRGGGHCCLQGWKSNQVAQVQVCQGTCGQSGATALSRVASDACSSRLATLTPSCKPSREPDAVASWGMPSRHKKLVGE